MSLLVWGAAAAGTCPPEEVKKAAACLFHQVLRQCSSFLENGGKVQDLYKELRGKKTPVFL